jgi:hypothetical protein
MKINFGLAPNARQAGPGQILKFRQVHTSTLNVVSHGIMHGRVVTSGGDVKKGYQPGMASLYYISAKNIYFM